MEVGSIEQRAVAAACAVAAERSVACEEAVVLKSGSNVLVHLRPSPVVARVMTGTVALHADPEGWLSHEVAVLGYLAPSRLAVAPSPSIEPGPFSADGLWMTFCELVEDPRATDLEEGAERLGRALRELHDELAGFAGELPGFTDLRDDIARLHGRLRPTSDLTAEQIESLQARLQALTVFDSSWPAQALHGDASLMNLLRDRAGRLVWNDFEDTLRGPVQWDLAGYLMSLDWKGADPAFVARALDAYGGIDPSELGPFTAAHHLYDEIWKAYDAQRRG